MGWLVINIILSIIGLAIQYWSITLALAIGVVICIVVKENKEEKRRQAEDVRDSLTNG